MTVPRHIGIIMDGNRRFAKRLLLKPWKGHEWGAKKTRQLFEWSEEVGVKELTLYTFSLENFKSRPEEEFNFLMKLFESEARQLLADPLLFDNNIRVNFIGRLYLFSETLQQLFKEIMEKTKDHTNFTYNLAVGYGGRAEVVDAVKKIALQVQNNELNIDEINENTFSKNLSLQNDPDLVVRTGGEQRTSNFFPYQTAYSELIFLDTLWPEFSKKDFMHCIQEYERRDRRYGK